MNKNTRAAFNASHDAFSRIKRNRSRRGDEDLAKTVGAQPRKNKYPKVAAHRNVS